MEIPKTFRLKWKDFSSFGPNLQSHWKSRKRAWWRNGSTRRQQSGQSGVPPKVVHLFRKISVSSEMTRAFRFYFNPVQPKFLAKQKAPPLSRNSFRIFNFENPVMNCIRCIVRNPRGVLLEILVRGVPPGSPNPDPISDQNMPFSTPVFRPGL